MRQKKMQHKYGKKFKDIELELYKKGDDLEEMVVNVPHDGQKFTFIFRDETLWISNYTDDSVFILIGDHNLQDAKKTLMKNLPLQLTVALKSFSHSSTPIVFPPKQVEKEVRAWLKEKGYDAGRFDADHMPMLNDWNSFDDMVNEIVGHFSYENGFNVTIADRHSHDDRAIEFDKFMNSLIPDYATQIKDMGLTVNPFYIDALEALRLGLRQLEKEKHDQKR